MHRRTPRSVLAAMVAALLIAVVAGDALALSWGASTRLSVRHNAVFGQHGLATTGDVIHVAFEEARGGVRRVWYRRSTDAGVAWSTPVQLSSALAPYSTGATIGVVGSKVDAAWLEEQDAGNWVVKYRRSTDAGATWGAVKTLSGTTTDANFVRLARDSADRVFVTWTDSSTGAVRIRRSIDGGATWLAAASLGTTTNQPFEGSALKEAYPAVAAGTGVVYVPYHSAPATIQLRRSMDGGATWTAAVTLDSTGTGSPLDVAASGSNAIVGWARYSGGHQHVTIRGTTDKGATWKSPQSIAPVSGSLWTYPPQLHVGGGAWRMIYEQDVTLPSEDGTGWTTAVYYRQSTDAGVTWSPAQKVSNSSRPFAGPGGVGTAGGMTIVGYWDWAPSALDSDVYVRRGG